MDNPPVVADVLARVRAYRKEARLSYSALALKADLGRSSLVGMDRDDWKPTSKTLKAIEAVMPPGWREGDPLRGDEPNDASVQAAA